MCSGEATSIFIILISNETKVSASSIFAMYKSKINFIILTFDASNAKLIKLGGSLKLDYLTTHSYIHTCT